MRQTEGIHELTWNLSNINMINYGGISSPEFSFAGKNWLMEAVVMNRETLQLNLHMKKAQENDRQNYVILSKENWKFETPGLTIRNATQSSLFCGQKISGSISPFNIDFNTVKENAETPATISVVLMFKSYDFSIEQEGDDHLDSYGTTFFLNQQFGIDHIGNYMDWQLGSDSVKHVIIQPYPFLFMLTILHDESYKLEKFFGLQWIEYMLDLARRWRVAELKNKMTQFVLKRHAYFDYMRVVKILQEHDLEDLVDQVMQGVTEIYRFGNLRENEYFQRISDDNKLKVLRRMLDLLAEKRRIV